MKNTQNRIIDIKALLCRILYQWRIILVLACILALLGGGKEYFSLKKAVAANKENAVESQKNTTADGQPDLTFSKELEMIDKEIAERQDYLRNTPSFDIEIYNSYFATHSFYIASETGEESEEDVVIDNTDSASNEYTSEDTIMRVINNCVSYKVDWESIGKQINEDRYKQLNNSVIIEKAGNVYDITVYYNNEQDAKYILDEIVRVVKEDLNEKNDVLHYSVSDLDDYSKQGINYSRFLILTQNIGAMNNLMTQRNNLLNNADIINKSGARNNGSGPTTISKKAILKTAIKFGVVGAALGVLLAAAKILLGSKVLSAEEFYDNYGFKKLIAGPIRTTNKTPIDTFIQTLFNGKLRVNEEEALQLGLQEIRLLSKHASILLVGDVDTEQLNQLKSKLEQGLDASVDVSANPLINSADRQKMTEDKDVIVVAKQQDSSYKATDEIVELLKSRQMNIIGSICQ